MGVQKLIIRLWFSPDYAKYNFSFSNLARDVDEKYLDFQDQKVQKLSIRKLHSFDLFFILRSNCFERDS